MKLTPKQIASKCIQGAIDEESKKNITNGGYLWDLEKEIAKDIEEYAKKRPETGQINAKVK